MINEADLKNKSKAELIDIISNGFQQTAAQQQTISSQQQQIKSKDVLIDCLYERVRLLICKRFCSSTERFVDSNLQGRLFDEAELPDNIEEIETAEKAIAVPEHTRKKRGRKPLPKELHRVEVIHDLSDADKNCSCGSILTHIGSERTEQLDIIPAKVQVLVHVHQKYACKTCEETIKTAKKPKQPIPNSIATPGLLAYVLSQKYQFHLPLYRQEQMLRSIGVDVPRATLSHWVIKCSELLQPLVSLLEDEVMNYDIAYADETTVQVLREPNKVAQSKSYMWAFGGGPPDRFSYVYHYHPSREHQKAIDFFANYVGYLHCDGYQAYDNLASKDNRIIQVGCWYHVRRKFIEAAKASKKAGLAKHFVGQIKKLSNIEKVITDGRMDANVARDYRKSHALPVIHKIEKALIEHHDKVSAQSLLGKAIHYALNQWPKLMTYLSDGRLEISNNRMERAIKPFATGRKNWLFANSVNGANAAAVIYSLVETCKAHDVDPYRWLRHTLATLPNVDTPQQIEALLPFFFKKNTSLIS